MHGIITLLFDCWADPVVHLLLLKSSMDGLEPQISGLGSDRSTIRATTTTAASITSIRINKSVLVRKPITTSVTRFGDFLHFGQLFKAFGNH